MVCPACGYTWDKSSNVCQRCGFRVNATTRSEPTREPEEVWRHMTQSGNFAQLESHDPFSASATRKATPSPSKKLSGTLAETNAPPERFSGPLPRKHAPDSLLRPLAPGALLRNGRYRVQELLKRQVWDAGAFEATWIGRDLSREKQVTICEVVIPEQQSARTLPIMHVATTSLLAVRHAPQITPLLDAFSDQGRSFFIFGLPTGETVTARMQHLQRPFSEQAVVDFCLQMTDILELFSQQSSVLVHGLICPEHISLSYDGLRYTLGHFSILAAGKATLFLTNVDRSHLSPYVAPEFARDGLDTRADLYSVLATAYYLATGSAPSEKSSQHVRNLNSAVSPGLDAIIAKGLHPIPRQRYQQPSQLRQDLLNLRSQPGKDSSASMIGSPRSTSAFLESQASPSSFPTNTPSPNGLLSLPIALMTPDEEEDVLLPAPETLPSLHMGKERLEAGVMLAVIVITLGIITGFSHFHV